VATYTPLLVADRYVMVRSSQNMGHFALANYGGSVTYKLFDKSLTLTGSVYGATNGANRREPLAARKDSHNATQKTYGFTANKNSAMQTVPKQ